jgi:hypothetical protein
LTARSSKVTEFVARREQAAEAFRQALVQQLELTPRKEVFITATTISVMPRR